MIVIDIGCAKYGGDYSIERLLEVYAPCTLYGFDPHPDVASAMPASLPPNTTVEVVQEAAWTYEGEIGYRADGLNSWVTELRDAPKVPCFDLALFIHELPEDEDIALKIDAEGSEYELLRHLMVKGVDDRLVMAWVEWHEPDRGRAIIEEHFAIPIQEWRW